MSRQKFMPNDWVIYRKMKTSTAPGPRATDVRPSTKGDQYNYAVDKYWIVEEVIGESEVKLCTRRGKRNVVSADDPSLRHASWWERILFRERFRAISPLATDDAAAS